MAKKTLVKSNKIQGLEQGGGIVFITFPDNWTDILLGDMSRRDIPADEFETMFGDSFRNLKLYTMYYVIVNNTQFLISKLQINHNSEINAIFGIEYTINTLDESYLFKIRFYNNKYDFEFFEV